MIVRAVRGPRGYTDLATGVLVLGFVAIIGFVLAVVQTAIAGDYSKLARRATTQAETAVRGWEASQPRTFKAISYANACFDELNMGALVCSCWLPPDDPRERERGSRVAGGAR